MFEESKELIAVLSIIFGATTIITTIGIIAAHYSQENCLKAAKNTEQICLCMNTAQTCMTK